MYGPSRILRTLAAAAVLSAPALAQSPSPGTLKADPARARTLYLEGERRLDRGELAVAVAAFRDAADLDPTRRDYALTLGITRDRRIAELVQQAAGERIAGHAMQAASLLAEARALDPTNELVREHAAAEASAGPAAILHAEPTGFAAPIQLAPASGTHDVHARGDVRQVVELTAQPFGITPVFDDSVEAQQLRFDLDAVPYVQAMPTLLRIAHLFAVPLDAHRILVARDTQENRQRLERMVEETLYIPAATPEQLNELQTIVKGVFDVRQVFVSPGAGTLTMRASEETVKAANSTLAELVDGGAEVAMQLQLISVDKSHLRNTGAQTPTSINAFSLTQAAQSIVSANQTIIQQAIASGAFVPTGNAAQDVLLEALFLVLSGVATDARLTNLVAIFGGGLTLFGVNLGSSAAFNLALNTSDARALDDITVRVGDRQTTTLRVGAKYPIAASLFSVGSDLANAKGTINGVSVASLVNQYLGSSNTATTPVIIYEDLGITLKATPTVLKSGLVSLHVELKIEALTGASANNIPVLASRAFTSDIIVHEGTTAVMLSELSRSEASSISGIPGLADLPGFRQTAADTLKEQDSSELVLMVTPRLVRRRSSTLHSRPYILNAPGPPDS